MGSPCAGVCEQDPPSQTNGAASSRRHAMETSDDDDDLDDGEEEEEDESIGHGCDSGGGNKGAKGTSGPMKNARRKGPGMKASGYNGVYLYRHRARRHLPPWRAIVYIKGTKTQSRHFSSEVDAAIEHDRMAIENGLTHCLNFPDTSLKVRFSWLR